MRQCVFFHTSAKITLYVLSSLTLLCLVGIWMTLPSKHSVKMANCTVSPQQDCAHTH
jgi:hypothetical protein